MKPKVLTDLRRLNRWIRHSDRRLRGMARELRSISENLPSDVSALLSAICHCQASIHDLSATFDAACQANEKVRNYDGGLSLTDADVQQLLSLNRQLRDITPFLGSVAEDLRPSLEKKVADPCDPMCDYEIEARIDFILREDDPDYDEDDDNILTTREESLKYVREDRCLDFSESIEPDRLQSEPHCWLFHDLYAHDYGNESPSLSFQDCLRIGAILIDIQVTQQYGLNVAT